MSSPTTFNFLPGNVVSDIILWVRRIIKQTSAQSITDQTIGDYINRFYVYDMPGRLQLFELKRQYTFETIPGIFEYQAPYRNYQMFLPPVYCDGVEMGWYQDDKQFYSVYPELVNNELFPIGDGTGGPYIINFRRGPILRGFVDDLGNLEPYVFITAFSTVADVTSRIYIVDGGDGILYQTDSSFQYNPDAPDQGIGPLSDPNDPIGPKIAVGTVDYDLGTCTFNLGSTIIDDGSIINVQSSPYSAGFPRICLFFNNIFKLYPVPSRAYKIQMDAYITPAQFMTSADFVPFNYMAEYISYGAARKILSDNADMDQYRFYEQIFREKECQVLRRTERQNSNIRTPTIFSAQTNQNNMFYTQY